MFFLFANKFVTKKRTEYNYLFILSKIKQNILALYQTY